MSKKITADIFSATNALKVFTIMTEEPDKEFLSSEIQKAALLSRAGVYLALKELVRQNLVIEIKKGKFTLYAVSYSNPIINQFKVLKNISSLKNVVDRLKIVSKKIVLFGSASRGEDNKDSDLDLFILAKDTESAKEVVSSLKTDRVIQPVIKSPAELMDFKEKEQVFYSEIDRGITLWEESE